MAIKLTAWLRLLTQSKTRATEMTVVSLTARLPLITNLIAYWASSLYQTAC